MRHVAWLFAFPIWMIPATALANTWCSVNHPDAVFCDDFDRYCVNAPPAPQECPAGSSIDGNTMTDVWKYGYEGAVPCSMMLPDTDLYTSSPFAAKSPNQAAGSLTRAQVSLERYCQAAFGSAYTSIMATDLNPLILEFVVDGQTGNKIIYANNYMELALGPSQASTDYRLSPNCSTSCSGGSDAQYPIVCQQQGSPADCPPLSTAPHLASIAVGALAYLDTNPCHCNDLSMPSPYNTHLSFFDGYQWWILKAGTFPGSGDFQLRNGSNRIRLTIKASTVKVELTCTDPNPDEYSWCTVPRDYLGRFSKLYAGFKAPCRLKAGLWECQTAANCTVKGAPGAGVPRYDNVALYGGLGYSLPGACCMPDYSCTAVTQGDCQTLGGWFRGQSTSCGQVSCVPNGACCLPDLSCASTIEPTCQAAGGQFHGVLSECADTACCAANPADRNNDGDVDMDDFGKFQACLTGRLLPNGDIECECLDLNHDRYIDSLDLDLFISQISGAGIPAGLGSRN